MVFGMGFATNSTTIPALCSKGTLIISDTLNHNSIVNGSRSSGAVVRVFRHNDPDDLEKLLRNSIVEGQPRTRRPWKKILIIVEGIYSMEGEVCRLPEIVELKKKYRAYLYVDEAHSIGALGSSGRGVCEHWGVDPNDIDILMGTFTKAFGSVGGYVAGEKHIIDYLKSTAYGQIYATGMSPPCAQQALAAIKVIMGEDGTDEGKKRIQRLHDNSNFFRKGLKQLGFHVFGDKDSPVVPMMMYHPAKLPGLSRALLARKIVVVIVGFPVTPLLLSRVRFCISSGHTREDLEYALKQISELGDILLLKYGIKK
jgi:serine palmitoyltransferase